MEKQKKMPWARRLAPDVIEIAKQLSAKNKTTDTAEVEAAIRERGQKQLQPRAE